MSSFDNLVSFCFEDLMFNSLISLSIHVLLDTLTLLFFGYTIYLYEIKDFDNQARQPAWCHLPHKTQTQLSGQLSSTARNSITPPYSISILVYKNAGYSKGTHKKTRIKKRRKDNARDISMCAHLERRSEDCWMGEMEGKASKNTGEGFPFVFGIRRRRSV